MQKSDLNQKEFKALQFIRNEIVHNGHSPSVREVKDIIGYESPRTAFLVINSLIKKGYLKRKEDRKLQIISYIGQANDNERTINVPLVGVVACGTPVLAEENIEAMIPVSEKIARPGNKYFLLRASGDSMNKAGIQDGDLVLVRQQQSADSNDLVVALINDESTIKKFMRKGNSVVLQPQSTNKIHQPIILTSDFEVQGKVVATIPNPHE